MPVNSLIATPNQKIFSKIINAHFGNSSHMYFSIGETIVNAHEEPDGVYLIKSGFVKAYSISDAGDANILLIHKAGEIIPFTWALDGEHTMGLFYEAMTDVTALKSPKDKLHTAMSSDPLLSQAILKQAINTITTYTQRIQTLQFRSARSRIIALLIYLAESFGKTTGTEIIIYSPITHQDIADYINMTRETASRALVQLAEEGLIGQKDHLFIIRNFPELQNAL